MAKKTCFYCASKNTEIDMREWRVGHDVVWYGCVVCANKMLDELYAEIPGGTRSKGKPRGKHAA